MYEWNPVKASINRATHGVHFGSAKDFEWSTAHIIEDARKDYNEPRYLAYGMIGERLHVMVFTPRGERVRIIGLRKANKREGKIYASKNT